MKEIFKRIILENQELNFEVISRDFILPETQKIISLIGLRRVGKSYILFSKIFELKKLGFKDKIIYINFDDERIFDIKQNNFDDILNAYFELFPENMDEKIYLFFDEIQNIDNWSLFVKRLYETKKYEIYITGSSSKLLSKEIATELRGRTLSFNIYTLSFQEFLRFKNFEFDNKIFYSSKLNILKKYFEEYLTWGGFPEILKEQLKIQVLNSYLDLTIYKDLIERYNIKNYKLIKNLAKYLLSNFSKEFSANAYYKLVKQELSLSRETIYDYLSYLEDVNFVYFVNKFDYSLKNQELSIKKSYVCDLGFTNLGFSFSSNNGQKLENLVFIELKRKGYEIFYHRAKKECDFLLSDRGAITGAIQVSWSLYETETKKRELDGLLEALKIYDLQEGIILTNDEEETLEIENKTIKIIPVWKWLIT